MSQQKLVVTPYNLLTKILTGAKDIAAWEAATHIAFLEWLHISPHVQCSSASGSMSSWCP